MTLEEKQQLKMLFVATSLYYGQTIPDAALKLYVEDLEDLSFADVAEAIKQVRRDPKTTKCPLPAIIRSRIEPAIDPESQAVIVANEIVGLISRCGPYQTPHFSEIARRVVQMEGGWQQVCELATYDNLPSLKAQWRGLAKGLIQQQGLNRPRYLELEDQSAPKPLLEAASFLKEMPK